MCSHNETKWSEEEFVQSDPLYPGENSTAHLAMSDVKFAMEHDHASDSITLIQRFTKMIVNEDGFSAPAPQQVTVVIPMGSVETVMLMLMENSICIATNSSDIEGKGH